MLRCECCELVLQHLDEEQRDAITEKFAAIMNKKNKAVVEEVENDLHELELAGYDVTNYQRALRVVCKAI